MMKSSLKSVPRLMCYELTYQPKHTTCATAWACAMQVAVVIETTEPLTPDIRRGIETRLFLTPGYWRLTKIMAHLTNTDDENVIEDAQHAGQIVGEPMGTDDRSADELREMGYVGIYRVEREAA